MIPVTQFKRKGSEQAYGRKDLGPKKAKRKVVVQKTSDTYFGHWGSKDGTDSEFFNDEEAMLK